MDMNRLVKGGMFGLFTADAVGVPAEFMSRSELCQNPVTEMTGGGAHGQPAGTWSDDSSMALCLMVSMIENGRIAPDDIMNRFAQWAVEGAYTPYGVCFDCGHTCVQAISRYQHGVPAAQCGGDDEWSNGNGSLMRILPLAYALYPVYGTRLTDSARAMELIHLVSGLTHRHAVAQSACGVYLNIAMNLMEGAPLDHAIQNGVSDALNWYSGQESFSAHCSVWDRIRDAETLRMLPEHSISSGGYVVDTLEAALWCLLNTDSYESCVLKAVNLGSDTDTTAAVAGGLSGLAYGYDHIPKRWVHQLARREMLTQYCDALAQTTIRL